MSKGEQELLIAMIHLPDLTMYSETSLEEVLDYMNQEIESIEQAGFDAIMIENFRDAPFAKDQVDDVVFGKLSVICYEARRLSNLPLGLNILRNASVQAMTLATMHHFTFIRSNIWDSSYVTDQGIIEPAALAVNILKRNLNSNVEVFADVHVKHAHPLVPFTIEEAVENAIERGKADKVIISGRATGAAVDEEKLRKLNNIGVKPVIGSGFSLNNMEIYRGKISGAIVGTSIKIDNDVSNPIDVELASQLVEKWKQ